MNRRSFLLAAGSAVVGASGRTALGWSAAEADAGAWRTYEVTTRVKVAKPVGMTRIWLPRPLLLETPFQRTLRYAVQCEGGEQRTERDVAPAMGISCVEFPAGVEPVVTSVAQVRTRDWAVDLNREGKISQREVSGAKRFLQPTRYVPTDGIVREKALAITKGAGSDVEKARAIYEWIAENTYRNPKTRGCGTGDIRPMLEHGDLGGKCADLNALFVGLARAAGLPARDVYGIRIGPSEKEAKSLGTASETVTRAQHCRAEVFLEAYGWVPVDPADVRKVVLEEKPGNREPGDPIVRSVRERLFGSWEMNWMAYNYAQDVRLPGSSGEPLHFLMYPQAETREGRLDSLDPESFAYEITAHALAG